MSVVVLAVLFVAAIVGYVNLLDARLERERHGASFPSARTRRRS